MNFKKIFWFAVPLVFLSVSCSNEYKGKCEVSGTISGYKKGTLEFLEVTQAKNYFLSNVAVDDEGKFTLEFEADEKSLFALKLGNGLAFFINDVPELSIETSAEEFDNYAVEGSPESEQLRDLITTDKKMKTEIILAEKLLNAKMMQKDLKFGYNQEILDLENKADKRSEELRSYVVNYIDTVHEPLLAIIASGFINTKENFNYIERFYSDRIENSTASVRQKQDLKNEIEEIKQSFKAIAPIKVLGGLDTNMKQIKTDTLSGKYVFVNVWASWCHSSRLQVPYIKKAQEKYAGNPQIEFISIAIDDNFSKWKDFVTREKFAAFTSVCDTMGQKAYVLRRFGLDYIPANFLLDKQGNIINSNMKEENIEHTIDAELKNSR